MRAKLRPLLWLLVLSGIALFTACKPTAQSAAGDIHLGLIWPEQGSPLSPQLAIGPDGTMYVLDDKSTLHAVAPNGQERWTYQSEAKYTGLPMMSSDGTAVYFLTSNNELVSVSTDGQLRWTFKAADVFSGPPVIAPDGTVYLRIQAGGQRVSTDGKGQAFTWPKNTDRSQAAFDSKGQLAIYNPIGYQLLILAPDGTVSAHCEEKMSIRFGPLIDKKDVVIYTLNDGSLVARDTACTELWRSAIGASQVQGADYPLALSADGTLYVSLPDGRIQLIDAESGKPLSTIEAGTAAGTLVYLTIAKDGTLYALNDQATLLAFRDGKQIWSQPSIESDSPGPLEITPDGGLAFVQAGHLYLYTRDPSLVRALPTPVAPPADKAQAEKEIVDFLLDFIVRQEIGGTADYIRNSGQPWVTEPPKANIIVWAPAIDKPDLSAGFLQSDQPTRVWWYAENQLTETEDKLTSIQKYRQLYMQKTSPDIWAWGYYEFGIVSIADDLQSAKVYVGASCGSLCGHGFYYTLRRSPAGKWWITKGEHLWQS